MAFAFDPKREAIILVAADKSGGGEKKFYKRLIKTADERFDQHLQALKENKEVDPMARTLNEVMKSLPKARRTKVEARAAELIAEEASLQDLRKAFGLTQVTMAKKLKVGQDNGLARREAHRHALINAFRLCGGMGGELNLVAEFPDRPPVRLQMLEPLKKSGAPARRKAKRA